LTLHVSYILYYKIINFLLSHILYIQVTLNISNIDNTNNLGFELYVIQAEVDGTGFPLAYLFLENNGKCGDGIRTEIITKFVLQLKEKGLDPEFILTDKDWAQINACHSTWPKAKIQLCRWHINRAITTRLQSDKMVTQDTYNGYMAHQLFSFIDPKFIQPLMIPRNTKFCPKELRKPCWNLMDIHLHQHILIPNKMKCKSLIKKFGKMQFMKCIHFVFNIIYLGFGVICGENGILIAVGIFG
jgi:hypothetical protein